MDGIAWNLALVLVFVLVGGFFAAAEIALVSLRQGQVHKLAERSRSGARVARLRADSNRFLSTVQIGVTFAGFFASSYGGATIAVRVEPVLTGWGLPVGLASAGALVLVTLLVSYLSLVLGELAPKRLALQQSERVAVATAGVLDVLAIITRPLIWLLSKSTNAVVRLLGLNPRAEGGEVSEEELRDMVRTSEQLSVEERQLLTDAFEATDRVLSEVMVPRTEADFLDRATTLDVAVDEITSKPHSRYPVVRDSADDVVGFVHVRDLLTASRGGGSERTVAEITRPVIALPGSKPVLAALSQLRRRGGHLAVVVDEYGGTAGIVTVEDLVEEVVGDIWDEYDPSAAPTRARRDGGFEADGLLHRSDFESQTGISLPDGPFDTLAGFVVGELGRIPDVGDSLTALGHRFTVQEMDGRRVSRLLVTEDPAEQD